MSSSKTNQINKFLFGHVKNKGVCSSWEYVSLVKTIGCLSHQSHEPTSCFHSPIRPSSDMVGGRVGDGSGWSLED